MIFAAVETVVACSCFASPPVDEAFAKTPSVSVAKLERFEEIDRHVEGANVYRTMAAVFRIEKVYKGNLKTDEIIKVYSGGGGDCSTGFRVEDVGEKFLFFMGNDPTKDRWPEPLYSPLLCSRSKKLKDAESDLRYLDNLTTRSGMTRLSGTIEAYGEDLQAPSVNGLRVSVHGPVKKSIQTDKDGFFEIWNLPAGQYSITYDLPNGWKTDRYFVVPNRGDEVLSEGSTITTIPVSIIPKKHTEIRIALAIDGQISGTILSPEGKPMKGVCVSAYWLNPTSSSYRIPEDCTDEKGSFRITELPPGNYRIEVNSRDLLSSEQPFKKFYYPGRSREEEAEAVTVGAGVSVHNLLIKVAKTVPLFEISGKLTFQDGQPFADEEIRFIPDDDSVYKDTEIDTDEQGNFRFMIPEGASGKISARTDIFVIRYEKCPVIKAMRKGRTGSASDVPSNVVLIDGKRAQTGLNLVFPLPYCKPN